MATDRKEGRKGRVDLNVNRESNWKHYYPFIDRRGLSVQYRRRRTEREHVNNPFTINNAAYNNKIPLTNQKDDDSMMSIPRWILVISLAAAIVHHLLSCRRKRYVRERASC